MRTPRPWLLLVTALTALAGEAATVQTRDGLRLAVDLPAKIYRLDLDGRTVSETAGGFTLTDPRTGQPTPAGAFTVTAHATAAADRIVVSGTVTAAGDQEAICQLQARLPVGREGWLFWDNLTKSRPVAAGGTYEQPVYPLGCVTSPDRRLGLAVALDPDPLQPGVVSYDPQGKALVVTWSLGFTPLGRPELRMKAPFKIELYRLAPDWAFRSALDRYYHFHPQQFDQRAKQEGMWLFASPSTSLPNPQHYAYNEGGPPVAADQARGLGTYPYTCTGDLTIALPPEWGTPKTYAEMLERLERWAKLPRLANWEQLSPYTVATDQAHSGAQSLLFQTAKTGETKEVRQVIVLSQKKPEKVTVSAWTRAQNVTGRDDSNYGLWLDVVMADGSYQFGRTAPAAVGTHDWQRIALTIGGDLPIQEIRLYLLLRGDHVGQAWFDDVAVTTASQPAVNLALTPGFESSGPPPEMQYLRDNVMFDQQDHYRYFPDTWGGADVGPASPINWLRFWLFVNPDLKHPAGRPTEADKDFQRIDAIFRDHPTCAGIYMDGTSAGTTVTYEYRREFFPASRDPFMYEKGVFRVCANGMASAVRYVQAFRQRYAAGAKLAFGNVWASNRMYPMCQALDVPGYESSRWYDLDYADYYRAALGHKPGLYLNYFRLGQQLDTREGGERFFRYATAYGLFPSIGRFTDEAYQKFGDLQHLYVPLVKHLFRAGWEPLTAATASDPEVRVQRYGRQLPLYFTLLNPTPHPRQVTLTVQARELGLGDPVAVEVSTSAALPLRRAGHDLTTDVTLGAQDVAVVALLPADGVGAWYRQRAAEILRGAALIYAQTPPTDACAGVAARVPGPAATDLRATAVAIGEVLAAVDSLRQGADKLPADLKLSSYRRELDETQRLLTESLLADAGARVGWQGQPLVASDDALAMLAAVQAPPAAALTVAPPRAVAGRLVELTGAALQPSPDRGLRQTDPAQPAVTFASQFSFTDLAGHRQSLLRRGYGYFRAVSELAATYEPAAQQVVVRLRNLDAKARHFRLELAAPAGVTLDRRTAELELPPGAGSTTTASVAVPAGTASGRYPVQVTARLADGRLLDQATVEVVYVRPLEPGDLALATNGTQVAVDSAYYGYDAKPLTDGVVQPGQTAFNQAAWAAAETADDHWVQLTWPQPQPVGRVVVYWNVENGTTWTSQHVLVQVKSGDAWRTLADVKPAAGEPVTTIPFEPVSAKTLRLWQPKDSGPATRPRIMWLREVAVYGR